MGEGNGGDVKESVHEIEADISSLQTPNKKGGVSDAMLNRAKMFAKILNDDSEHLPKKK